MSKIIYNEGRVVGYSAYEQYFKQALAQDPDSNPASEREWLSSTIADGSSMLLKVTPNNDLIRDFFLPSNTRLCAANTIVASFFIGEGHFATNNDIWADRITNYGNLLANSNDHHPSDNVSATDNVPIVNPIPDNYEANLKKQLMQYIKISDGIVIQPGTWEDSRAEDNLPKMKLSPDLSSSGYPRIRLSFKSPITTTFYILFTGFTNRVVIQGTSGIGTSANTPSPQDGDFLGPATYPWANKIIFNTPSILTYYLKTGIKAQPNQNNDGQIWDNVEIHQNDDTNEVGIEVKHKLTPKKTNVVITPEDNTHAANTIIDVKNNIHTEGTIGTSGKEFIKITQSTDQSETKIEVIPKHMVIGGLGVGVNTNEDGSITLKNLFPNYNDDSNRIRVYPEKNYTNGVYELKLFNNWKTGFMNMLGYDVLDVMLNPSMDADGNLVACAISVSSNNSLTIYTDSGAKGPYFAKLMNSLIPNNVRLNHAAQYHTESGNDYYGQSYTKCIIGRIRFNDTKYKLQTYLKNAAASGSSSYRFMDTTTGGSGVWNIVKGQGWSGGYDEYGRQLYDGSVFGASWNVYSGLRLVTEAMIVDATKANSEFYRKYVNNGEIQPGDLIMHIASVADGYNHQFYRPPYCMRPENGNDLDYNTWCHFPGGLINEGERMFTVDVNHYVNGILYRTSN